MIKLHALQSTSSAKCSSKKRKHVVLTLDDKRAILDRLKSGTTQEKLAAEYGVGHSTIGDIKKNQDKLRSFTSMIESLAMSSEGRKMMRSADDENSIKQSTCGSFRRGLKICP